MCVFIILLGPLFISCFLYFYIGFVETNKKYGKILAKITRYDIFIRSKIGKLDNSFIDKFDLAFMVMYNKINRSDNIEVVPDILKNTEIFIVDSIEYLSNKFAAGITFKKFSWRRLKYIYYIGISYDVISLNFTVDQLSELLLHEYKHDWLIHQGKDPDPTHSSNLFND